ncbi:MAG: histidine kinase [Bacteroidota bacterium]|nr:histidine kinase [Bacteroidota bacterium]
MSFRLKRETGEVLLHILAWGVIFALPYIFSGEFSGPKNPDEVLFQKIDSITNVLWMGLFYLNALVLMPKLFYRKHYLRFFLTLISAFIVIMLLHGALFTPLAPGRRFGLLRSSKYNIIPFLFTVFVSMIYTMVADKIKSDMASARARQESLKTELSFLRSQVSPHFLFNVLNNMAAMARLRSQELEPTIMKLSAIMQYMLYETDDEKVALKGEVDYLSAYIDLQRQRFGPELKLDIVFDVEEEWQSIEPMLLIPFVENAFKHGAGLDHPEIAIHLSVRQSRLSFVVKNKFQNNPTRLDKSSGIGLSNLKRRLELLRPAQHQLSINKKDGYFIASLNIQLTL